MGILPEAGLLLGAVGPMVLFASWTADPFSPPKLACLAVGVALAWFALAAGAGAGKARLGRPLIATAAAALLAAVFSIDRRVSLFGQPAAYAEGLLGQGLCALLLLAVAQAPAAARRRLAHWVAAAGALIGAAAVLQSMGFDPLPGGQPPRIGSRPTAFNGSPVYAGAVLAASLPSALWVALEATRLRRAAWGIAAALCAAGALSTLSRGAALAAASGAAVLTVALGRTSLRRAAAGLAAVAALALAAAWGGRNTLKADAARLEAWGIALHAVGERPLSGWGPDTYGLAFRRLRGEAMVRLIGDQGAHDNAHDDILQTAATKGLPGLAALLWLWWSAAFIARARLREAGRRGEAALAAGGLAACFVQAKFDPAPLAAQALAALYLGLLCADDAPEPRSRARAAGAAAAALAALALAARVTASERALRVAGWYAAQGEAGLAAGCLADAAAWESGLAARASQVRYLTRLGEDPSLDPPTRQRALRAAAQAGEAAAAEHPQDAAALQMKGVVWLAVRRAGGPDELGRADAALAEAARLDPWYRPIAMARRAVAGARADAGGIARADADLARIGAAVKAYEGK